MNKVGWAKWITGFDMEHLVSSILQDGMFISIGFVTVGLFLQWVVAGQISFKSELRGENVLQFILGELHRSGSPRLLFSLWVKLGIAALLLTPYVREVVSLLYFVFVERSWKHMLFTAFTLIPLTYILLLG